ncbi:MULTISPECIES: hypothetical protein [unclassified Luteococcus]|uniref:hypothetical protein n=1 Tax=unclassified Luteococcus TaxID=2639923 RepID=UPI00313C7083
MSNQRPPSTPSQTVIPASRAGRPSALRRAVAGLAAAGAIAFGGVGTLSVSDAQAAGVRQQTYVVQSATVQVQATSTGGSRARD